MAIMIAVLADMPSGKAHGDDTSMFLNPLTPPPPPAVAILLDTSGSMTSLPCAVPDTEDSCGLTGDGSSYFLTQWGYNPAQDYGYSQANKTCFDGNITPGGEGCFYGGTSAGSASEGPLGSGKTNSGAHVYINGYFAYYTVSSVCNAVRTKGPGGNIPSYWYDCGTIDYFCNNAWDVLNVSTAQCISDLTGYGYEYVGQDYYGNDEAYFSGNLLNFYPPKFVVTRKVISDLINFNSDQYTGGKGVRIGIFSFDSSSSGAETDVKIYPPCSQLGSNPTPGNYLNTLYSLTWDHSTPLGGALIQVAGYFANNNSNATWYNNLGCGGNSYCSGLTSGNLGSACSSNDSWCGCYNTSYSCEKNDVIVMTDGNENDGPSGLTTFPISTDNQAIDRIPTGTETCDQAVSDNSDALACSDASGGDCHIDEVANFLHVNSIRPPDQTQQCVTIVNTYTIGFAGTSAAGQVLNTCALQRAASTGGGLYASAQNWKTLEHALYAFLASILQRNLTYGTPSLPQLVADAVTNTTSVFKAYVASFVPKDEGFWVGHLREYTGAASSNGQLNLYDATGNLYSGTTSQPGQCSYSESVPPPIWDAGADLSCTTAMTNCFNGTTLQDCPSSPAGAGPCYLAPDRRSVYTVTPGLLSGFTLVTTGNGDSTWTNQADSLLGTGQRFTTSNANFQPSDFGVTDTTTMNTIIDYVLGPKSDHVHVLGDIYHSDPTLVSVDELAQDYSNAPDMQIKALDYQGYLNAIYNRPQIIIAGANDGMVHAFYAGTYQAGSGTLANGNYVPDGSAHFDLGNGQEVWAFIPYDLLPKLQYMQNPALVPLTTTGQYWTTEGIYTTTTTNHVYYVDASPFVRDVWLPGLDNGLGLSGNAAYWHTIMIIGERLGGTDYICLDITDVLHPRFLWEFTTNNMGFTFGQVAPNPPPIGPVWLGYDPASGAPSSPTTRWVAVLSGGWDPGVTTNRGRALYVIDVATGKLVWKFDQSNDPDMSYPTPATPATINQSTGAVSHPWWMEAFLPDLGGQLWQFSFMHVGDAPGTWWAAPGSNGLAKTCASPTDTNCFWGQRVFAAKNPPPVQSQAQQFYYQPSAVYDACNDLWVGIAAGDRNDPLSCAITNYLFEINSPMPYLPQTPLLTSADLTQLTNTNGINTTPCGAGSGWYIALSSFTGTSTGTKSLSITYAERGIEYSSLFTPNPDACTNNTSQFSCVSPGGTGLLVGIDIYEIPGSNAGNTIRTGQLLFTQSTGAGIPASPMPVTSILGSSGSGSPTPSQNPFSIPVCGFNNYSLTNQIYESTNEGKIYNVWTASSSTNMTMYPYYKMCIPRNVENDLINPQNTWSSHGR